MKSEDNAYAEGHVVLKSEIKDNKIYAYILTEYGVYSLKGNKPNMESGSSIPLTLIFEILDSNEYELAEIKEPKDGDEYESSLKEVFPEDLISSTSKLSDGIYEEEFNKQILEYLKNLSNNQTSTVTEEEIKEIEKFVNNTENQVFALINYNSPDELFTNKYNEHNISEKLRYSLNESKYAIPTTTEQNKIIWKENNGDMIISTKVTNISDIIKFLNEKLNYTYSENDIRKYFTIDSELDKYVIMVSDTLFGEFKVKNATKDGNKYNVKLTPKNTITSKDIDIVLTKENDTYYFYSCNLNNVEKLSQEKIAELEKFINEPGNNAFVSFNYKNSSDVITETYNANKAQTISMGLIEGGYAKIASEEEQKLIDSDTSIQIPHVISLDEIDKFFTEKLATSFGEDVIKKSFKYEYNEKLGKIVLITAGALEKNDKIKEGYKIGEFNEYH